MKLTIKRSEWLRGESNSMLLRPVDGKKCCLGFFALEVLAASPDTIINKGLPHNVPEVAWPKGLVSYCPVYPGCSNALYAVNTAICNSLIRINDNLVITDEQREASLKEEFAKIDIEVEFVD